MPSLFRFCSPFSRLICADLSMKTSERSNPVPAFPPLMLICCRLLPAKRRLGCGLRLVWLLRVTAKRDADDKKGSITNIFFLSRCTVGRSASVQDFSSSGAFLCPSTVVVPPPPSSIRFRLCIDNTCGNESRYQAPKFSGSIFIKWTGANFSEEPSLVSSRQCNIHASVSVCVCVCTPQTVGMIVLSTYHLTWLFNQSNQLTCVLMK